MKQRVETAFERDTEVAASWPNQESSPGREILDKGVCPLAESLDNLAVYSIEQGRLVANFWRSVSILERAIPPHETRRFATTFR